MRFETFFSRLPLRWLSGKIAGVCSKGRGKRVKYPPPPLPACVGLTQGTNRMIPALGVSERDGCHGICYQFNNYPCVCITFHTNHTQHVLAFSEI